MEAEDDNKSVTGADSSDQTVSFPHVTAVATGWMLDFLFLSLCRRFKEDKFDEFNETLSVFEAISQNMRVEGDRHSEKTMICAFLARVMHGKMLDIMFEEDESVMPLMSAAKIWLKLKDSVEDESMFNKIKILLLVQSVAVCMEKGQRSSATSALKWLQNNHDFPQNVGAKLKTVLTKWDTYHPFLTGLSLSHLLKEIHSYLDAYLDKNPSDYLLKAATEKVLTSGSTESLTDSMNQESSLSEKTIDSTEKGPRTKRKLLSTKMTDLWKPESSKKPFVSLRRLPTSELNQLQCEKSNNTTEVQKKRKAREKWTKKLDRHLKAGVERHGVGKWAQILQDYDFQGRTGTMLKDRWRVLLKADMVSQL
ncbi:hypothetical protein INR49_014547 [Caranx melampygus]|nr:hypothetical protein INR49_014547 [Caranx melampygus]